jgi:hypothetical protein
MTMKEEQKPQIAIIDDVTETQARKTRVVIIGAGKELAAELAVKFANNGIEVIDQAEAAQILGDRDHSLFHESCSMELELQRPRKLKPSEPSYRRNFKTGKALRF